MSNQDSMEPPKWMNRLLQFFLRGEYLEEIEGDLAEMYYDNLEQYSQRKTSFLYLLTILRLLRPVLMKNLLYHFNLTQIIMFYNYFKISWRRISNNKLYAFINIGGLSMGILCFIAILLYVNHELSYDNFKNAENIYRVFTDEQSGETYMGSSYFATIPLPLAEAIKTEIPEVKELTCFEPYTVLLKTEGKSFTEEGFWVDAHFFDVFSYEFSQGSPSSALSNANDIVLTESFAKKLFGEQDPIGKEVTRQVRFNKATFTVSGIVKDPPKNSSFQFSYLAPLKSHIHYQNSWDTSNSHTFLVLDENVTSVELVHTKIEQLLSKFQEKSIWTAYHKEKYLLQPLLDYHLENQVIDDVGTKGDKDIILIFSVVAILILLLACINYANLAIARSTERNKEVGVRKVVGAKQIDLIGQFLSEAVLLTSISMVFALVLLQLILPSFSGLVERSLSLELLDTTFLPLVFLVVLVVGIISGSYPAFIMSALRPIASLKGKVKTRFSFQKVLITAQYAVSIVMMIACLVIYQQFEYILQSDTGYNKEHIITVKIPDFPSKEKFNTIKNELKKYPSIKEVTASKELPTNITSNTVINYEEGDLSDPLVIYRTSIADDFLEVFQIDLLEGQNPSNPLFADSAKLLVLNETACNKLNWSPSEAIGQEIKYRGTVIGVVKDFQMLSFHHSIEPLMMQVNTRDRFNYMSVKINPGNLSKTIDILATVVGQYSDYPFNYQFLDNEFDHLYKQDIQTGKIMGIFAFLAIVIASLGLFGMSVYTVYQRMKEIGIRKVFGATLGNLIQTLSFDFLKIFLIGFFLAVPAAWYFADYWLNDFTYKIGLSWWMFVLPGLAVILFAFLVVSSQSVKASLSNPIHCLKDN